MVKFTAEELRRIIDNKKNNNRKMPAHVDQGMSTLTDSLVEAAKIIAQEIAENVSKTDITDDYLGKTKGKGDGNK